MGLAVSPAVADESREERVEERRKAAVAELDKNQDGSMRGAELAKLKKSYPQMWENIVNFCVRAKEDPRREGVMLPADEKEAKKLKCTKTRVDYAYLGGWTRGGETPKEERSENE